MKKILFLIITGISIFILTAIIGLELISKNDINQPEQKYQEITKVNAEENVAPIQKVSNEKIEIKPVSKIEESSNTFKLIYPVDGKIGLNYSPDTLIYSKTLQEWTTHNGIDIQAPRGTAVKASEAGIIENITETSGKGIEITISHGNGYKTIYSNLSSKDMVKLGQKIEKGQVISGIGNTASFEYYEPDHLHFEVIKDSKYINPLDIL